jgi:hypothetical protein
MIFIFRINLIQYVQHPNWYRREGIVIEAVNKHENITGYLSKLRSIHELILLTDRF